MKLKKLAMTAAASALVLGMSMTSFAEVGYYEWYTSRYGNYDYTSDEEIQSDPVYYQYLEEVYGYSPNSYTSDDYDYYYDYYYDYDGKTYAYVEDAYWSGSTAKWDIDGKASKYQVRLYRDDKKITTKDTKSKSYGFSGSTDPEEDGRIHLSLEVMQECIQRRAIGYDKDGNNHYDTISAFIKSMRGSDPDAAVYYLARMLEAGEDIKFIARRIMICASEDVGLADPMALTVAVNASLAVERVGMPEARILLSEAAVYVASAPKSNASYMAINIALERVRETGNLPIPTYLRDVHYEEGRTEGDGNGHFAGNGTGYKYAHSYPGHYVEQQYLPDAIKDERFFTPGTNGYELSIRSYLDSIGKMTSKS